VPHTGLLSIITRVRGTPLLLMSNPVCGTVLTRRTARSSGLTLGREIVPTDLPAGVELLDSLESIADPLPAGVDWELER